MSNKEHMLDSVAQVGNTPPASKHYHACPIEPIDVMARVLSPDEFRGFLLGNIIKYRLRAGHKDNVLVDFAKARQYEKWYEQFMNTGYILIGEGE